MTARSAGIDTALGILDEMVDEECMQRCFLQAVARMADERLALRPGGQQFFSIHLPQGDYLRTAMLTHNLVGDSVSFCLCEKDVEVGGPNVG